MSHRVLITGGSGYLGGSLLAAIPNADLPAYDKLYALVRTDEQAKAVQQYGAQPLSFNPHDEAAVRQGILDCGIDVVFYLVDAFQSTGQVNFIKALGELKKTTGKEVHFLHVRAILHSLPAANTNTTTQDDRRQNLLLPRWRAYGQPPSRHRSAPLRHPQSPESPHPDDANGDPSPASSYPSFRSLPTSRQLTSPPSPSKPT